MTKPHQFRPKPFPPAVQSYTRRCAICNQGEFNFIHKVTTPEMEGDFKLIRDRAEGIVVRKP